jgi:hypothetical protein
LNQFHSPVILGGEHGMTWAASDDDAFALNAAVPGAIKDAIIRGSPKVLRSVLGYVAASRAVQGGTQAFMDATKYLVANMLRSMTKKLEIEMLYGQMGYATTASASGSTFVVTTKEWAPGIWAGAEGMPIELRDTTTGALMAGPTSYIVSSVSLEARTVTTTVALDASVTGAAAGAVTVWHKGAYGNEFAGIHKILSTSGTLFGINAGTYQLFKGNTYDVAGTALSFTKMNLAAARPVEKGHDGKLSCFVNPRTWANLLSDQAALRKYDSSYSSAKVETGGKSIMYYSQNGELEIIPSIYIKEGYSFMLNLADFSRVGSQDVSFKRPGLGDDFVSNVQDAAGFEFRLFTDQALFTSSPGSNVVLHDIVNAQ